MWMLDRMTASGHTRGMDHTHSPKPIPIHEMPGPPPRPGYIQVLTPLGASYLFGRSGEAVRRAAREGHVRTRVALAFTAKQVRLLDLQSCINYWAEDPWPTHREPLDVALAQMRRYGITLRDGMTDYEVLHSFPLAATGDSVKYLDDLKS